MLPHLERHDHQIGLHIEMRVFLLEGCIYNMIYRYLNCLTNELIGSKCDTLPECSCHVLSLCYVFSNIIVNIATFYEIT